LPKPKVGIDSTESAQNEVKTMEKGSGAMEGGLNNLLSWAIGVAMIGFNLTVSYFVHQAFTKNTKRSKSQKRG
jgi:hypothetical protein